LDGQNIDYLDVVWYRKQIAMFEREVSLFPGSVAYNIAYGCDKISMEEIVQAAKVANAHRFISQLQDGYMTFVGEQGIHLSATERTKITLARLFIRKSKVIILDEPTLNMNSDCEDLIVNVVSQLSSPATETDDQFRREKLALIIISSNPRILACAETIINL